MDVLADVLSVTRMGATVVAQVAESGLTIDEAEVQRARLAVDWH